MVGLIRGVGHTTEFLSRLLAALSQGRLLEDGRDTSRREFHGVTWIAFEMGTNALWKTAENDYRSRLSARNLRRLARALAADWTGAARE